MSKWKCFRHLKRCQQVLLSLLSTPTVDLLVCYKVKVQKQQSTNRQYGEMSGRCTVEESGKVWHRVRNAADIVTEWWETRERDELRGRRSTTATREVCSWHLERSTSAPPVALLLYFRHWSISDVGSLPRSLSIIPLLFLLFVSCLILLLCSLLSVFIYYLCSYTAELIGLHTHVSSFFDMAPKKSNSLWHAVL